MEKNNFWLKLLLRSLSYALVAVAASVVTLLLWGQEYSKLSELEAVIGSKFIGEYDKTKVEDAAAKAMVNALSDRWSGYFTAEEYAAHQDDMNNTYLGVGITIKVRDDGTGMDILAVTPGGPAQEVGILPGDVLIKVEDQAIAGLGADAVRSMILGQENTQVSVTVLRDAQEKTFTLERRKIKVQVASGEMLEGNIGLVRITNFHADCGKETIAVVEQLQRQGATALIFDVRNNPGGYVTEMLEVLDYLLPEGALFRQLDYLGNEKTEYSDAACLEMPMTVLVNGNSYSAAEFFAACLQEKDWATVVGEQTCGKGYYQNTIPLSDGSAVNLSIGKYFTPNGVNLTETGGVTLDVPAEVDEKTAALIYAGAIPPTEDPQVLSAVAALKEKVG